MRAFFVFFLALAGVGGIAAQTVAQPANTLPQWHYGVFADLAYLKDTNSPANDLYRFRSTTPNVDEPVLDMAAGFVRKDAIPESRWGMELTLQGGKDSQEFGYSGTAPNLAGSRWLRHLGPTNISYLAPVGRGLTIQAGVFSSLIGYESLYAKDNFAYTRAWGADYTPYLMMGINAGYAATDKLTLSAFLINGYAHLSRPNHAPTTGGQMAYKATGHTTLKETLLYGPQQANTAPQYWRFFSDSIAEWKAERFTTALEYQAGEEKASTADATRALWMAAMLPLHWAPGGPWSFTVRPEVIWDRNGLWTGAAQSIKAVTTTVEYRATFRGGQAAIRLEHRYDNGQGTGAGFYYGGYTSLGEPGLRASHNLVIAALIVTVQGSHH